MNSETNTRPYRQSARARAAEESTQRILDAFVLRAGSEWFDEIRLDDVASDAGVTVQTVIRKFGGKDGLLDAARVRMEAEIMRERHTVVGDVRQAIALVISEYERVGDLVMNMLNQELRYPAIHRLTDLGRQSHRALLGEVFAPWLERLDGDARRRTHDKLVIATDLYVWKLVRRDMGRSIEDLSAIMLEMSAAALGCAPAELTRQTHPIPETVK